MRVVAGGHEQEEAHDDLVLLELLAVDLGVDEDAGQVVGRVLAALGDQLAAALEDLGDVALHHGLGALGVDVGVAGAERRVHQARPDRVVLRRDPHEAADHARDDGLGDVVDEVAGLAALEPVEHVAGDLADLVLVLGDPLRGEAALEERLEPVVLRRVHADEHRLHQLERDDRVGERGDAAVLGRVGLPVAADRVHVVLARDRPEAGLVGVLGDLRRPVDRALRAQPLEQLVRRAVGPELPLADLQPVELELAHIWLFRCRNIRHGVGGQCDRGMLRAAQRLVDRRLARDERERLADVAGSCRLAATTVATSARGSRRGRASRPR